MIHGGETVARISCDIAHTREIFHSLPVVDYIVLCEPSGYTFERFPELRGVW